MIPQKMNMITKWANKTDYITVYDENSNEDNGFCWSTQTELLNLLALFDSLLLALILFSFLSEKHKALVRRLNLLGVWVKIVSLVLFLFLSLKTLF